jgi:hypothetical protein
MERRAKVELFERIRREYEFGLGSIKGVAARLGVHRRMVRQALSSADPPGRKPVERVRAVIGPVAAHNAICEVNIGVLSRPPYRCRHAFDSVRDGFGGLLPVSASSLLGT